MPVLNSLLSRTKSFISSITGEKDGVENDENRPANKSVQDVLGGLNSSKKSPPEEAKSEIRSTLSGETSQIGNKPRTSSEQPPKGPVLVYDEVSKNVAGKRKKENILVTRAAFKRLCQNLKWHETKGKGFKYENYQNFAKKYQKEYDILSSLGMSFAHLGVFIYDYLQADPEAEVFQIRETVPKYYSDWLVVLTRFYSKANEEDAVEPTLSEIESGDDECTKSEDEETSGTDTDEELLMIQDNKSKVARKQSEARLKLMKNDFEKCGANRSSKDLCSTMMGSPKKTEKVVQIRQPISSVSSESVIVTNDITGSKTKRYSETKPVECEQSINELLLEQTNAIQSLTQGAGGIMSSLLEAFQMNTPLDTIDTLKDGNRDPTEWFAHYEMIVGARQWSERVKARMLRTKLKGTAARLFKQMTPEEQDNYSLVKQRICEELRPRDSRTTASVEYFGARQKVDECVLDYAYRLNKLKKRADLNIDNSRRVEIFIKGLTAALRQSCAQYKDKQYEEVVKLARDHEALLPDPEEIEINAIQRASKEGAEQKCYYCKQPGHMKGSCKKWLEICTCYRCKKTGHLAVQCPLAQGEIKN